MSAPRYTVTTLVDGRSVGGVLRPIPDPFIREVVTVGWRALLRGLLRGRLEVSVAIGADRVGMNRVLELNPDYLGPSWSPSRRAWEASLNKALEDV